MVYVDKVVAKSAGRLVLSPLNVHRLLLASLLVAVKAYSDEFYNNSYFASVGGVSTTEMNALERLLLKTLDFDLVVRQEEFHFIQHELLAGFPLSLPLRYPPIKNQNSYMWSLEQVEADLAAQNDKQFTPRERKSSKVRSSSTTYGASRPSESPKPIIGRTSASPFTLPSRNEILSRKAPEVQQSAGDGKSAIYSGKAGPTAAANVVSSSPFQDFFVIPMTTGVPKVEVTTPGPAAAARGALAALHAKSSAGDLFSPVSSASSTPSCSLSPSLSSRETPVHSSQYWAAEEERNAANTDSLNGSLVQDTLLGISRSSSHPNLKFKPTSHSPAASWESSESGLASPLPTGPEKQYEDECRELNGATFDLSRSMDAPLDYMDPDQSEEDSTEWRATQADTWEQARARSLVISESPAGTDEHDLSLPPFTLAGLPIPTSPRRNCLSSSRDSDYHSYDHDMASPSTPHRMDEPSPLRLDFKPASLTSSCHPLTFRLGVSPINRTCGSAEC